MNQDYVLINVENKENNTIKQLRIENKKLRIENKKLNAEIVKLRLKIANNKYGLY